MPHPSMAEVKTANQRSFLKKIGDAWLFLIGDRGNFALETRIFHSITIGLVLLGAFDAPYDLFSGLYVASLSCVFLVIFFSWQYYNSRFKGVSTSSAVIAITGIIIFSINYFSNSGINGSTDLIWPSYLLLVLAISPYRQHLLWIAVYIVAFFLLHLLEYNHPEWVKHPFDLGKGEFIDRVTAFPLPVIGISLVIGFIRRSYDKERQLAEEKAAALGNSNAQIRFQKEELEKSNAEKNKLLSIISHDLRAPFNSISSYLHLLNDGELEGEERQMVERSLIKSTDQTMEMLSNLLYWSKSQMDGTVVNLAKINLLETLKNTLEVEKTLAVNKDITLSYQIGESIYVLADTDMLQLVVRNLVNNAIKFTPAGGTIDITTEVLDNQCKLSVADSGLGIEPDQKDKIFTMTSRSTFGTNNEKGVGLGLSLCKEFIELQGGSIGFESAQHQGSIFYIIIPL